MKLINLSVLLILGVSAFAQNVQFDYDRSANFGAYRTYQWIDYRPVQPGDELLDKDIKRAVDEQLAGKGLRRVESGGDLTVGYELGVSQEKEFDNLGSGWGPWGPWGNWGNSRVTTSTIDVGKLVVGLFDPAIKQLVWRGSASKTLNISKDPDKNYRNLEKAMAKLFKNYPPGTGRK
jgi:beta-galactosidase GanA